MNRDQIIKEANESYVKYFGEDKQVEAYQDHPFDAKEYKESLLKQVKSYEASKKMREVLKKHIIAEAKQAYSEIFEA